MDIAILFASENASKIEMTVKIVELGFSIFMKAFNHFQRTVTASKAFSTFHATLFGFLWGLSQQSKSPSETILKFLNQIKKYCFKLRYIPIALRSKTCVIKK